ncbi:tripartite tricarboxylate transporter TctB family protein [Micrococcus sp. IITD107]|uniref:tripartite tricarboxylate transporter TctB family protein n=1 Tax=Micrococcus sp. IITD107 TaxID=3342790 RepID=UPI0035BA143B
MASSSNSRPADHPSPAWGAEQLDDYEGHPQRDEPGPVDWYSAVVLAVVGVIFLIPSLQLGIGSFDQPGAGLWPFLNCLVVLLLAPVILLSRHRFHPPSRKGLLRVAGVAIPLLIFVPLYDWAGLIGAGAPALLIVTRFVGGMRWVPAVIVSILTPVVVYILFALLLGVNLRAF